jgi:hypothetical protein
MVAAVIATMPITADAADWWVLDGGTVRCVAAKSWAKSRPDFWSPGALEAAMRRGGVFGDKTVERDDERKITHVFIRTHDEEQGFNYYPSQSVCEVRRAAALADGRLTDPEELK